MDGVACWTTDLSSSATLSYTITDRVATNDKGYGNGVNAISVIVRIRLIVVGVGTLATIDMNLLQQH